MILHHAYALISNEKVQNIIVATSAEIAQQIAQISYPEDGLAICCDNYPIKVNDLFQGNRFYTENEYGEKVEIAQIMQDDFLILNLKSTIEELKLHIKYLEEKTK